MWQSLWNSSSDQRFARAQNQENEYVAFAGFNYLHTYAVAGTLVAVVLTGEQDRLPLGIQIASQVGQDHVSLTMAAKLEALLGGFKPQTAGLGEKPTSA